MFCVPVFSSALYLKSERPAASGLDVKGRGRGLHVGNVLFSSVL